MVPTRLPNPQNIIKTPTSDRFWPVHDFKSTRPQIENNHIRRLTKSIFGSLGEQITDAIKRVPPTLLKSV